MENGLQYLLNDSESDLDSFGYMEIGKVHRDRLNWERRGRTPKAREAEKIAPLPVRSLFIRFKGFLRKVS